MTKRKISVMRCELASCRGGVNGCNGSECQNPRWDKVTAKQYAELYSTKPTKPPIEELVDGQSYWIKVSGRPSQYAVWRSSIQEFWTLCGYEWYAKITHIEPIAPPSWAEKANP